MLRTISKWCLCDIASLNFSLFSEKLANCPFFKDDLADDDDRRSDYKESERHIYDGEEGSGTESEHSGDLSSILIDVLVSGIWLYFNYLVCLSFLEDDFIVTDDGQQPQHRHRRYRYADVPEQAIDDAREIFGVDDFNFAEFYDEDAEVIISLINFS